MAGIRVARLFELSLCRPGHKGTSVHRNDAVVTREGETISYDHFAFDPKNKPELAGIRPRSLLDVHHRNPLEEGVRYTTTADFALLCPTCHRIEHALPGSLADET